MPVGKLTAVFRESLSKNLKMKSIEIIPLNFYKCSRKTILLNVYQSKDVSIKDMKRYDIKQVKHSVVLGC